MKNLYLDIDGTLLTKSGKPANGLTEFLKVATEKYNCYWLTTHCNGDATQPFLYLVGKVSPEAVPYLEKIKPTTWRLWKTEGINFDEDFIWLDDCPFEGEQKILAEHQVLERLIVIDLKSKPDQLMALAKQM